MLSWRSARTNSDRNCAYSATKNMTIPVTNATADTRKARPTVIPPFVRRTAADASTKALRIPSERPNASGRSESTSRLLVRELISCDGPIQ
jgi:hypothetical protein